MATTCAPSSVSAFETADPIAPKEPVTAAVLPTKVIPFSPCQIQWDVGLGARREPKRARSRKSRLQLRRCHQGLDRRVALDEDFDAGVEIRRRHLPEARVGHAVELGRMRRGPQFQH